MISIPVISLSLGSLPNNTNCGKQYYSPRPVSKRIVGGQEVWANSWPWMVQNFSKLLLIFHYIRRFTDDRLSVFTISLEQTLLLIHIRPNV